MSRAHFLFVGKARECPRFADLYADTFPALCGRQPQRMSEESNPSRISEAAGLPQSRPVADRGGGA